MNIELFLYLTDILGNVQAMLMIFPGVCFFVFGIFLIALYADCGNEDTQAQFVKKIKELKLYKIFYSLLLALLIASIIPTKKTMYLILGANYLKNSELPSKVELLLNKRLDEYLSEEKK